VSQTALTDRAGDAVLFRLPGRDVTAGAFVADAMRLSQRLPEARYAINLCAGRYAFAVGFAAALLRGQTSLLTSDRAPHRLQALAAQHPDAIALCDDEADLPLPRIAVPPPGDGRAASPLIPSAQRAAIVPSGQRAAIVFTSGSTGEPVAHAKTWGALAARSRDAGVAFGLDPAHPATAVGTVPPQHMYGFETTVLWPLHAPVSAWCGPAFFPADIRSAANAVPGERLLVTTPLQLRTLLSDRTDLPALRRIISATAPLDPALAEAAERQWGTEIWEIFGATEVGSIASRRTVAGAEWTPYPGVRLSGADQGLLVQAEGAADTVLDDDVEHLPSGGFRLLGRRSDVVKLGGRRASLAGLNRALMAVAGVQDGVFVPPPANDQINARMTALVVAPGATSQAIIAALRGRIDPLFLPRRVVHLDRLPRNELGKLAASTLQALAAP
jgi:acyl-coenzyme A synthetase/AMP-(fatty) acid ligase